MKWTKRIHTREVLKIIFQKLIVQLLEYSSRKTKDDYTPAVVFSGDTIGNVVNATGGYEKEALNNTLQFCKAYLPEKFTKTALDCGANIGTHSIVFSRYFQKVISFEPSPRTYVALNLNTQNFKNIHAKNVALSNIEGNISIEELDFNTGATTVFNDPNGTIECKLLDHIVNSSVGLIKFDIEGHEYNALLGARNIISSDKPVILIEQRISDFEIHKSETKAVELLRKFGYKIYVYNDLSNSSNNKFIRILRLISSLVIPTRITIEEANQLKPANYDMLICINK